jgi:hypothetical protein
MKPEPASVPLAMRCYWAIALCFGVALLGYVFVLRPTMLWDFKTGYSAAWLVRHGQNPYDNYSLFAVSQPYHFPFAYPLPAAWLFAPFTFLDYSSAALIWLGIIAVAWTALALLWWRYFHESRPGPQFPLLFLLLFNLAVAKNVVTGNVATVESLLLWAAFVFLARGNVSGFVALLVAAASFKLTPLLFLALPLVHPQVRRWKTLLIGAAVFGLYLGLSYVLTSGLGWLGAYQANLTFNVRDWALRGVFNPSVFALARRLVFAANRSLSLEQNLCLGSALYLVAIIPVIVISARAGLTLARREWSEIGKTAILYATLVYALIVPRFSDYSFTLVIPATLYVLGVLRSPAKSLCLTAALLLPLPFIGFSHDPNFRGDFVFGQWAYWSLLMVFVCWCLLSRRILRDHEIHEKAANPHISRLTGPNQPGP